MNPLSIQVAFSGKTRLFQLTGPFIAIGSAPDCSLVLPFPWISPQHLEIEHGLLLSRIRCAASDSPATLDGYPISAEWAILPKHGLIEIPSPLGGKLVMAIDLEAVPVTAAIAPSPQATAPQPQYTGPINVPLRSDRPQTPDNLLAKYVPLAIAALLLLGVITVLLVLNNQAPPAAVATTTPAPPATPATEPAPTTEIPAAPTVEARAPAAPAPTSEPVVKSPPPAPVYAEPATRIYKRRQIAIAPATGPSQYEMLEEETRDALAHRAAAPLKSDLLRTHAYEQVQQAVRNKLKDAASINFPDLESGQVAIDFHDGVFIARGEFESTNTAGVPIRQIFYCKLRPTDNGWDVLQTELFGK